MDRGIPPRGGVGRDASLVDADPLSRGHAARAADQAGKGARGQALGRGARERAGQAGRGWRRDLHSGAQRSPAREGTGDAPPSPAQVDQTPAPIPATRPDARRVVAQTRRGQDEAGKAYGLLRRSIRRQRINRSRRKTFHFALDRKKLRAARRREGGYLLRSNIKGDDPGRLWRVYLQLVEIEQAFKELKNRSFGSPHPSPTRNAHRSPHFRGLPRLLPDGHAETAAEGAGRRD